MANENDAMSWVVSKLYKKGPTYLTMGVRWAVANSYRSDGREDWFAVQKGMVWALPHV